MKILKMVRILTCISLAVTFSVAAGRAGPIGLLADASIVVPPNPGLVSISESRHAIYSETYNLTVFGGSGSGFLKIFGIIEGIADYQLSDVFSTFGDLGFQANGGGSGIGSSAIMPTRVCQSLGDDCTVPIVFGVPFDLKITARVHAAYGYGGLAQNIGLIPSLGNGGTIPSRASVFGFRAMNSNFQYIDNAEIIIVPEPSTAGCLTAALALFVLITRARVLRPPVAGRAPRPVTTR